MSDERNIEHIEAEVLVESAGAEREPALASANSDATVGHDESSQTEDEKKLSETTKPATDNVEEEAETTSYEPRRRFRDKLPSRYRVSCILRKTARRAAIASWVALAITIIGNFTFAPLALIAAAATMAAMAISSVCDEAAEKAGGYGHGMAGWVLMIVALVAAAAGFYGLVTSDAEISTASIAVLFLLGFAPAVLDAIGRWKDALDEEALLYDEDGNWDPPEGYFDDAPVYRKPASTGNVFAGINEVFGIPQPVEPPAIEVSRDDIPDEDGHEIAIWFSDKYETDADPKHILVMSQDDYSEKDDVEKSVSRENHDTL